VTRHRRVSVLIAQVIGLGAGDARLEYLQSSRSEVGGVDWARREHVGAPYRDRFERAESAWRGRMESASAWRGQASYLAQAAFGGGCRKPRSHHCGTDRSLCG
ncbi:MAG TPA: hypothetical protein PKD68_04905, partial [Candidatus Saccharibacteria bacterium]|nr:hypothetical protein [Candidatus Saccharibacteria bacterium]